MQYLVGFIVGVAVATFASYLTWAGELRRKGLDTVLDFYGTMVSATEGISRFIGQWGGMRRIDLGFRPGEPNRPEVREFWEARGKLVELRVRIDSAAIFLNRAVRDQLVAEWQKLWDGFHASGADVQADLKFQQEMWEPCERVALIFRRRFMSWRGFAKSLLGN